MNLMNPLSKLIAWATGQDFTYDRSPRPRTKYVTTRHPTKKGPGRSRGRDAMSAGKKVAVRNGAVLTKLPKHIPSGLETGIGVNGIRGAKGGGRDAGAYRPSTYRGRGR
jgi:hypothetical protein